MDPTSGITSPIAVAIAPLIIILVHLIQTPLGDRLPDRYLPVLCVLVSTVVVAIYVISTTGFVSNQLFTYVTAVIVSAATASGIYSWNKTIT